MATCHQCGDVLEPAAAYCPACGVSVQTARDIAARDIGDATHDQRAAAIVSAAPAGAWSEPPARVSRLHATRAATTTSFRAAAALAIEAREYTAPSVQRVEVNDTRVVALHREPVAANEPAPQPATAATLPLGTPAQREEATGRDAAQPRPVEAPGARPTPTSQTTARMFDGGRATPSAQSAGRPPVLASEALRKELAPATPAASGVRQATVVLGALGACATLLLNGPTGLGLPLAGAFLAMTVLGAVPMPYQARAAALVTLSGSGLAVVTWTRIDRVSAVPSLVLLIGVLLLAMALLFRAWHRASVLARAMVALGASLCAGWLAMSDSLPRLLVLEAGWQHWLPAVVPIPLAVVLLLSLLAFMDSRSTGGCGVWAAMLLGWYALYGWAELLPLYVPPGARSFDLGRVPADLAITFIAGPLFAAVLAFGLAQLLSVATAETG